MQQENRLGNVYDAPRGRERIAGDGIRKLIGRWILEPFFVINDGLKEEVEMYEDEFVDYGRRGVARIRDFKQGIDEEEAIHADKFVAGGRKGAAKYREVRDGAREQEHAWNREARGVVEQGRDRYDGVGEEEEEADGKNASSPRAQTAEDRWREEVDKIRKGRYKTRGPEYREGPGYYSGHESREQPQYHSRRKVEVMKDVDTDRQRNRLEHWTFEARDARKPKGRPKIKTVADQTFQPSLSQPYRHPATVPIQR